MIPITYDRALKALRKSVAGKDEGYIYTGRTYRDEHGNPLCLVADALVRLGVNAHNFPRPDGVQASAWNLLVELESRKALRAEEDVRWLFANVQRAQDTGSTWHDAVEYGVSLTCPS